MSMMAKSPSARVRTRIVPLPLPPSPTTSEMACAAFTTMLSTTWLNSAGEQCTAGQVGVEIHFDLGHVFPLVAGDGDGALDRAIEVGGGLLARRVRELFHGAHDLGDAIDAFERLIERARDFFLQVFEVGRIEQLARRATADVDELGEQ